MFVFCILRSPWRSGEVKLAVTQYSHCEYWLNAFAHILVVELGLTGLTSTSRSSRTTCSKSLALLRSSDSVLSVHPRILLFDIQRVTF